MVKLLTTPPFGFLVVLALSLFLLMKEQIPTSYSSLLFPWLWCVSKGFRCYDPFLIAFVSPVILSFENIVLSRVLSSFLHLLPQSLPFLLIFSSLSILNLWRILRHQLPLQTTHLRFCPRHMTRLSWILWHHPFLSLLLVLNFVVPLG